MNRQYTPKEIVTTLLSIEKRLNLLNLTVDDVYIWQFLRVRIYIMLMQKVSSFQQPHTDVNTLANRLKHLGHILYSTLFVNPFFSLERKDILIFDHPRKIQIDGAFIDIYTDDLINTLLEKHIAFEVYEDPYLNRHHTKAASYRKHTDSIWVLTKLFSYFVPLKTTSAGNRIIDDLEKELDQAFNVNLNLKPFFYNKARQFKMRRYWLKQLLKRKRPKKIFLVVNYEYAPLIAAAKSLNIVTIELQHGLITTEHLGYSFPHLDTPLAYFPDKLYVWNSIWKEMPYFPIDSTNIIIHQFAYLHAQKKRYAGEKKSNKHILILSQGTISEQLARYLYENRTFFAPFQLIIKLHPGEYTRWHDYDYLTRLQHLSNITIIDNDQEPLYKLFARCATVIGVYSTALYEALEMDCKLYIVDLPGYEYVHNLIASGKATVLDHTIPLQELS